MYSFNMCDPFRLYLLYNFYTTSNYYRSCFFKTVFTTIPIPICWTAREHVWAPFENLSNLRALRSQ